MEQYTPELYRALLTPVSIDLGSTVGAIADIRTAVQTTIPTAVAAAASDIGGQIKLQAAALNGIPQSLTTLTQRIGTPKIDLLNDVKAMITLAASDIVNSVQAVRPHIVLEERGAPLVRLLVQAQAVVIDATPSEPYNGTDKQYKTWSKNDVALHQLLSAALKHSDVLGTGPIKERLVHAFDRLSEVDDLLSRSKRFDEIHRLIEDIAAYLNDPGAAAGQT